MKLNKSFCRGSRGTVFSKRVPPGRRRQNQFIREIIVDKIYEKDYIFKVENKMLTKTMKIEDNMILIPELEKYKGKVVEITVREKGENKKMKLNKFFSLCGKVSIDGSEINRLREESHI
jgi:hypothetical protein